MGRISGKNSIDSKLYNRGLVLQLIATGVCHSRIELSRTTGLAKMTVSNIISEFIEKDILVECEEELTEVCGRNPIILQLSENAPKIIGVLIFRERIEAVLCDLKLEVLHREKICFQELNADQLIDYTCQLIDRILEIQPKVAGIGVAGIGPVDIKKGEFLNPVRFYGIHNLPILSILKERYDIPVYFDHDNNSAALAEKLYGTGRGIQDFIFLGISNGIGSGIVSNGEIYHSYRGLESEIGHVSIDYNGPKCSCGNHGCLEMYASVFVVLKRLQETTGENEDFAWFCQQEDSRVSEIFEDTIKKISAALVSSINILQPELIILGHDCMEWQEQYVQLLENLVNANKIAQDERRILVRKAFFGKNAQLVGAAANVVDQIFKGKLEL